MSDLEFEIRRILSVYRQRYRVVTIPWADDEAVNAILTACESAVSAELAAQQAVSTPAPRTAPGAGDGKPGTPARRTGRPGAAKRPRATTMTISSAQPPRRAQ